MQYSPVQPMRHEHVTDVAFLIHNPLLHGLGEQTAGGGTTASVNKYALLTMS